MDPRVDYFGPERLRMLHGLLAAAPGWQESMSREGFTHALVRHRAPHSMRCSVPGGRSSPRILWGRFTCVPDRVRGGNSRFEWRWGGPFAAAWASTEQTESGESISTRPGAAADWAVMEDYYR